MYINLLICSQAQQCTIKVGSLPMTRGRFGKHMTAARGIVCKKIAHAYPPNNILRWHVALDKACVMRCSKAEMFVLQFAIAFVLFCSNWCFDPINVILILAVFVISSFFPFFIMTMTSKAFSGSHAQLAQGAPTSTKLRALRQFHFPLIYLATSQTCSQLVRFSSLESLEGSLSWSFLWSSMVSNGLLVLFELQLLSAKQNERQWRDLDCNKPVQIWHGCKSGLSRPNMAK